MTGWERWIVILGIVIGVPLIVYFLIALAVASAVGAP